MVKVIRGILLALLALFFLLPVAITFSNSFMNMVEIAYRYSADIVPMNALNVKNGRHFIEMSLLPRQFSLMQYINVFTDSPFYLNSLVNSIKLTFPVVTGQIAVSCTVGYFFSATKSKTAGMLFLLYIVVMIMPDYLSLVSHYLILDFLNITNEFLKVILPRVFNPLGVFICCQFMKDIPKEYIESAMIDGGEPIDILMRIIVPISRAGIVITVIMAFIDCWDIVEPAIIFIRSAANKPLSILIPEIAASGNGTVFAASCIYLLFPVLIFAWGYDDVDEGIRLSGLH